jgi:glycerol uptake facilitator-like aquaporin
LLENSVATALGLTVLIVMFGPVSGAHFNPVVSLAAWALGGRDGAGPAGRDLAAYLPAQVAGGIGGAVLANVMFALPAVTASTRDRSAGHLWLGEVVATAGLIALIFSLVRTGRTALAPGMVGAYIGAVYWFTSSTSFVNPAVAIGRGFSDTFAGIAPASIPGFIVAELFGAGLGAAVVVGLYPRTSRSAAGSGAAAGSAAPLAAEDG